MPPGFAVPSAQPRFQFGGGARSGRFLQRLPDEPLVTRVIGQRPADLAVAAPRFVFAITGVGKFYLQVTVAPHLAPGEDRDAVGEVAETAFSSRDRIQRSLELLLRLPQFLDVGGRADEPDYFAALIQHRFHPQQVRAGDAVVTPPSNFDLAAGAGSHDVVAKPPGKVGVKGRFVEAGAELALRIPRDEA